MTDFDTIDYFTDPSLVPDPHPYFDHLRRTNPVQQEPHYGVVAVTGYAEAAEVYRNPESFSSCISVTGPFPPLPFTPVGDDIGELIERHRSELPLNEHMVTMDPPQTHPCAVAAQSSVDSSPAERQRGFHVAIG